MDSDDDYDPNEVSRKRKKQWRKDSKRYGQKTNHKSQRAYDKRNGHKDSKNYHKRTGHVAKRENDKKNPENVKQVTISMDFL